MAPGRLLSPLLLLLLPVAAAAIDARPGPDAIPTSGVCWLPLAVGRCRAAVPRWWFNASAGSCQPFVFGGCDGNGNNFASEWRCRESCAPDAAPALPARHAASSSYAEECAAPRLTGPCRAAFPRWYFVPANGTCLPFIYGGCRGNKNNYQDEQECLNRCRLQEDHGGLHSDFVVTRELVLGVLLAILAAILLGYLTDVALRVCRRKTETPGVGPAWNPGEDKEYLMSNTYTL